MGGFCWANVVGGVLAATPPAERSTCGGGPRSAQVLVISKNVGDCFNYGVFEHQMMLKNLAFVGLAESNSKKFHINAADIMTRNDDKVRGGGRGEGGER